MIQIIAHGVPTYVDGVLTYIDNVCTYDSRLEEDDLVGLKVTRGLNKGGTAEIVMPPYHPSYSKYAGYRTVVEIYRDGVLRFRGRALYPIDDFHNQRTVVCEGEMCFLQDAIIRPYLYETDPAAIFADVMAQYNAQVDEYKRFTLGDVTVTDPNDYIRLECESAESALAVINKLVERCGGYIVFTTDQDGARTVHWLATIGRQSGQAIEIGENLLDFASSGANTDLATMLIPYGAKDETTGERVTVTSVNDGKDYIVDETTAGIRGLIAKAVTWDDVTEPSNLLTKARQYLNECKLLVTSLTLTALDLSWVDKDIDSYEVGDRIRVRSAAHNLDEYFQLTEQTEDLLRPEQSTVNLGKEIRTLTQMDVAGDDKSSSELKQVTVEIRRDIEINVAKAAAESEQRLTSIIEQQANSIKLEVSGSLGSKAEIKLTTAGGEIKTAEMDLRAVRQAFATDTSSVAISGGTITFNSNTLIVNSTNLQVGADGTIRATNAVLTGTATTENGKYKSELSAGRLRFFYDGTEYGGIASEYMANDANKRGVTVRLTQEASFMGFSRLDEDATGYEMWYCINFGANINGRTEQHLFFGSSYFSNQMTVDGILYANSSAFFSGAASFLHNATFNAAVTFEATATFDGAVVHNGNAFFANGKGVALYRSDGKTVFSLMMDASNRIYIGSQDAAVYVVGSSVQVGTSSYPTTIAGSSVAISNSVTIAGAATFNNGYGLLIKDSGGTAQYVFSFNSSNQVCVGNASFPLYLRGTGVTIASGGLSLGQGSAIFANGYGVVICDASGASHYVLSLTSGNMVNVGVATYPTYLRGTAVYLSSSGATVTSDRRKKHSIEELGDAYEAMLDKLTPVRFKYNNGTSDRFHVGYIAQDVQEALEATGLTTQDFGGFVDVNKDGEELGLIYTQFIALQHLKIRRLEQRLAALEGAKNGG